MQIERMKNDDLVLYPLEMPRGGKRYMRLSDLKKLQVNVCAAIHSAIFKEVAEVAYMEELHRLGTTRKDARRLAIGRGIHYMIFDRWAKTKHWKKNR